MVCIRISDNVGGRTAWPTHRRIQRIQNRLDTIIICSFVDQVAIGTVFRNTDPDKARCLALQCFQLVHGNRIMGLEAVCHIYNTAVA